MAIVKGWLSRFGLPSMMRGSDVREWRTIGFLPMTGELMSWLMTYEDFHLDVYER